MITASPPIDAMEESFGGLAPAARRALGSEGVVIVAEPDGGAPVVADHEGLSLDEVERIARGLGDGAAAVLEREFDAVLSADVVLDGERLGSLHAVQRGSMPFEQEDLIGIFATQAAIALGLRGRPPLVGRCETLGELDRLVLSVHELDELSAAVTDAVGPVFGGAQTGVMVADPQRNVLQMVPGAFGVDDALAASLRMSIYDPRSNSARVFATGQPYLSNLSKCDPGIREDSASLFAVERLLSIPLRRIGVLHIANKPEDFTLDDVQRGLALAPRIANIVELAITLLGLRRQQQLEGVLADVAVAVASGATVDTFLRPALEDMCAATDANLLAILPDTAEPIVARRGSRREDLERAVLDEADGDPGIRAYVIGPRKAGDQGWAAFYVPVRLGGQRLGTLAALRIRGEPFAEPERRALARLADLAALARATERYKQQRADLARLHERQRIADDLHDDVAQILFAAQLSLDMVLQREGLDEPAAEAITRARALLIRGDTAIRTVIHRLSSPPAADIGTRLAAVVATVEDDFMIPITFDLDPGVAALGRSLRQPASDALVRVAREALVNAAKHAGPCQIVLSVDAPKTGRLVVTVADHGGSVAAPDGAHHHGLASLRRVMRDQGGALRVSRGASGTRVTAGIPLHRHAK